MGSPILIPRLLARPLGELRTVSDLSVDLRRTPACQGTRTLCKLAERRDCACAVNASFGGSVTGAKDRSEPAVRSRAPRRHVRSWVGDGRAICGEGLWGWACGPLYMLKCEGGGAITGRGDVEFGERCVLLRLLRINWSCRLGKRLKRLVSLLYAQYAECLKST